MKKNYTDVQAVLDSMPVHFLREFKSKNRGYMCVWYSRSLNVDSYFYITYTNYNQALGCYDNQKNISRALTAQYGNSDIHDVHMFVCSFYKEDGVYRFQILKERNKHKASDLSKEEV
jgi:hypothetical protein